MACPCCITIKPLCLMFRGNETLVILLVLMVLLGFFMAVVARECFSRLQLAFIVASPHVFKPVLLLKAHILLLSLGFFPLLHQQLTAR